MSLDSWLGQLPRWAPLLVVIGLGVWLLASPMVLDYGGAVRTSHLVVGPLVASLGAIALGPATRGVRWANVLLGAWLVLSPVLVGHPEPALWSGVVAGLGIGLLSLFPGPPAPRLGGGWRGLVDRERLSGLDRSRR